MKVGMLLGKVKKFGIGWCIKLLLTTNLMDYCPRVAFHPFSLTKRFPITPSVI